MFDHPMNSYRKVIERKEMEEIRRFLVEHRAAGSGEIADDVSLLEQGVIDSVTMVDLITFLESHYGIHIDDEEMTPENFDSLNAIVALVASKQTTGESTSASQ